MRLDNTAFVRLSDDQSAVVELTGPYRAAAMTVEGQKRKYRTIRQQPGQDRTQRATV